MTTKAIISHSNRCPKTRRDGIQCVLVSNHTKSKHIFHNDYPEFGGYVNSTKPMQEAIMQELVDLKHENRRLDKRLDEAERLKDQLSESNEEHKACLIEVDRLQGFLDQARELALVWKEAATLTWFNNGKACSLVDRALQLDMDLEARGYLKEARTLLFRTPDNGK